MKYLASILLMLAMGMAVSQEYSGDEFKEDYLEACELISSKYIYFERKCALSRSGFLEQRKLHADTIIWNRQSFVKEIRNLRATFSDGHFYWDVPREISPVDTFYTLGFVSTFTDDSLLIVKKIFPHYAPPVKIGDIISDINNIPAKDYIKELGRKEPQSTRNATYEIAARNLSLIRRQAPTMDSLEDVKIEVLRDQKKLVFNIGYKKCSITTDISKSRKNKETLLLQRNGYLSLEDLPDESISPHSSLLLYMLETEKEKYCILHPRDFVAWEAADIETIMGMIKEIGPDALVIDLKDCSGGGFNDMLYLSYALGVEKEFKFFYDIIDKENRRESGVDDFDFITDRISMKNSWSGKVYIRSNEICGSACDFFIRWMKMNGRAVIVGMPPAGRGGGTDDFKLKNTGTRIGFPLRERIPLDYPSSIEGETMGIDYYSEQTLDLLLDELSNH
ncbi:MAG: hypothetical protein KJ970_15575 [Candidatus Eisenbacteria bacterium]|uniref:Tail specific protease domain-containing protein n=1 Tax=Eiseniibacteriota bacterium TaxID=2212470 RepID=A0A948RZ85_UNCEI|nr:hypothetical protein [Candidatus Eisenbacteria bacterium]MBU1947928.1 hypothetical protein [Candidatus Eisenbacteria bacterium]MBU2692342.1 hypothetical protein [Candidatus Eisenbacteria bacterium]